MSSDSRVESPAVSTGRAGRPRTIDRPYPGSVGGSLGRAQALTWIAPRWPIGLGALPSCASLHRRALHIDPDDERAAVRLSEVGDGLVEIEQTEMTDDELSDAGLLRYAAYDHRCCM